MKPLWDNYRKTVLGWILLLGGAGLSAAGVFTFFSPDEVKTFIEYREIQGREEQIFAVLSAIGGAILAFIEGYLLKSTYD